jgi:thioredoxin-dependent peroxiredoxin
VLHEGDPAPDFELPDQDANPVRLSSLRGRTVVVYFYPRADTPGCTAQACGIRDHLADYEQAGAVVLGVSPDDPARLRKFADKYGLPFTLLADPERKTIEAYGVWREKRLYGKTTMGVERSTFVIGPDGTIQRIMRRVKSKQHDELVLSALQELDEAA